LFSLRLAREHKGLTLLEVAKATSVSEGYMSLIETGQRRPSVDLAKRIAAVLDFDWTLFFEKK
jgi:transcriptional regulator with XRE-family HTH domain